MISSLDGLDVARAYMRAWNRADDDALAAVYQDDARAELFAPVAAEDGEVWSGRDTIASGLRAFFAAYEGGFAGGTYFDVRTIARIETGWTHVEWTLRVRRRATGESGAYAGYFHFRIINGLIVEHRAVAHPVAVAAADFASPPASAGSADAAAQRAWPPSASTPLGGPEAEADASRARSSGSAAASAAPPAGRGVAPARGDADIMAGATSGDGPPVPPRASRMYPSRPIVGVGAVIIVDGRVVLVKRKYEPLAGQWSLPGGSLEVGETLEAGVAREMLEETGLQVDVGPVIDVFDRILLDADRRVRYHFVLIDYLCTSRGGELRAASDVADVRLADPGQLAEYRLTPKAEDVIRKGVARWKAVQQA